MLLKDPEWEKGCVPLILGALGFVALTLVINYFGWEMPRAVGKIIGLLIALAITRWILNAIFD